MRKKILLIQLTCFLALLNCSKHDPWPIDEDSLSYFANTFDECRNKFLTGIINVKGSFPDAVSGTIRFHNGSREILPIDYLYVPAVSKNQKLFILTSGVHGVEGFVGSAVQLMFLKEIFPYIDHKSTGYLIIHGLNPWGMKHFRRVTENNVDFNRNCGTSLFLFKIGNKGYKQLYNFLNPSGKVSLYSFDNIFFVPKALLIIMFRSMKSARQAVLQGQYQYPDAIYYGGNCFEPQKVILEKILNQTAHSYKTVLAVDLHTGFGSRGTLHLFGPATNNKETLYSIKRIFRDHKVDFPDDKDFYQNYGDVTYFESLFLSDKKVIPMTFEYGTLNTQILKGSLESMRLMIMENQGYHFGYSLRSTQKEITHKFLEMYYPSSAPWRSRVMRQTRFILAEALRNF